MTAATYTTNLADIFTDGSTTGWTAIGTGAAALTQETDYYIQGTSCMSKGAFAASTKGMIYSFGSDAGGSGTDGAYIAWMSHTAPNSLASQSAGGMQFLIGSATGAYEQYYVGGSDTLTFLKWELVAVNEAISGDATTGSPSATVESFFGGLWDLPSAGPTKGAPNVIDGIRYGRCDIIIEFGDTGTTPSFDTILTDLETATNRYGLLVQRQPGGAFENSGLLLFGTSTNPCTFTDSNKTITIRNHNHVTANFHTWEVRNASSVISFTNLNVAALGTVSPGRWLTTDNATMTWTSCNFTDMGTFAFLTNTTIDSCTFRRCAAITHGGANMSGSTIATPSVAADTSALVYNIATDPNATMTNMEFSKGAASHHAIELGTSSPTSMTFTGVTSSGFNASNAATDSFFHVKRTTGTVTLNLVGTTGNFSYKTDGATVVLVVDPVTTTVTVRDNTGALLQDARVYLEAADGTAALPFEDSVSISVVSTTATVTHTAHGMADGDQVMISGCNQSGYNGAKTITYIDANSYSYTVVNAGAATGTIIATGILLNELTTAGGIADDTRSISTAQPVTGWVRKSSGAPYFKTFPISGTVSTTSGLSINVQMILDQ